MARKPWTLESIEQACRKEFVSRGKLDLSPVRAGEATAEWEGGGPIHVIVDRLTVSEVNGAVHEVMHRVLERELSPFVDYTRDRKGQAVADAQEVMLVALEEAIAKRIRSSERRKAWWRKAIRQRTRKK